MNIFHETADDRNPAEPPDMEPDAPSWPFEEDAAWWAEELSRMDREDEEWLEEYRGAVDAVMASLKITDEDMARVGAVG